jgi:hypothetical protein
MTWLQIRHPDVWPSAYAIPNGGHRHVAVAARMKDEGVKPGVPDLCIAIPRGSRHGLYLELKATGTTASAVSKEQREWIARLRTAGYAAEVAHGFEQATQIIEEYLGNA